MRIAIVTPLYPSDRHPTRGTFIRDQTRCLLEAGHEVVVVHIDLRPVMSRPARPRTPSPTPEAEEILRWTGWSAGPRSIPWMMRLAAGRIAADLEKRQKQPEIVHGHFAYEGGVAAAVIADRLSTPMVITEHSTSFQRGLVRGSRAETVRSVIGRAAELIAVSDAMAMDLRRVTRRVPVVVPNVVDVDAFPARRLTTSSPPFEIVSVGSLNQKKGYDLLLQALALVEHSGWRATIIGGGPDQAALERMRNDLHLDGKVKFVGSRDRAAIQAAMAGSDLFVSPSRYETFGIAIAEALSVGIPVVATLREPTFVSEPYGLLAEPEPVELARAISRVMQGACRFDPEASHERIRRSFAPSVVARSLSTLYGSVIGHA